MTWDVPRAWVGDQVCDPVSDCEGVISDVKNGVYILRPVYSWAHTWTAPINTELEITLSREEPLKRRHEEQ